MKKFLSFISIFLLGLTIVGCKPNEVKPPVGPTDADIVAKAKEKLTLGSVKLDEVIANFSLPQTGEGQVVVTWVSNHTAIAIDGLTARVTRPAASESNAAVKLTATLKRGDAEATKDFDLIVLKEVAKQYSDIAEAIAAAENAQLTLQGVVTAFSYKAENKTLSRQGFYLTDTTGTIYVYGMNTANEVQIGDEINITATRANAFPDTKTGYTGNVQMTKPTKNATIATGKTPDYSAAITGKKVSDLVATPVTDNLTNRVFKLNVKIDWFKTESYQSIKLIDPADDTKSIGYYMSGSFDLDVDTSELDYIDAINQQTREIYFMVNGLTSKGAWRGHILAEGPAAVNPAKEAINKVANPFKAAYTETTTEDLPAKQGEHNLTWTSSDAAIEIAGTTATITVGESKKTVKITVSVTVEGKTASKDFTVAVGTDPVIEGETVLVAKSKAVGVEATITGKVVAISRSTVLHPSNAKQYANQLIDQFVIIADETASIIVELKGNEKGYTRDTTFAMDKVYTVTGTMTVGVNTLTNVNVLASVTNVAEVSKQITTVAAVEIQADTAAKVEAFIDGLTATDAGTLYKLVGVKISTNIKAGETATIDNTWVTYFDGVDTKITGKNRAGIYHDDVAVEIGGTYDLYLYFVGSNAAFSADRILRFCCGTIAK